MDKKIESSEPIVFSYFLTILLLSGIYFYSMNSKRFAKKIRKIILSEVILKLHPKAILEDEKITQDLEATKNTNIFESHKLGSGYCIEKSIVSIDSPKLGKIRYSDTEMWIHSYGNSGSRSKLVFDGLVASLEKPFKLNSSLRTITPKEQIGIPPSATGIKEVLLFLLGSHGMFEAYQLAFTLVSPEALLFIRCVMALFIGIFTLSLGAYILLAFIENDKNINVIYKKDMSWIFDKENKNGMDILNRTSPSVLQLSKKRNLDIILALNPRGIYLAFPKLHDFLEVPLGQSLVSEAIQKKWQNKFT